MRKRKLFTGAMTGILASAMVIGSALPTFAATANSDIINYAFKPVTNVSQLTPGQNLLMLKGAYSTSSAVVDLPGESAKLTYVKPFDDNDSDYYFGYEMYYADGTPMAQGCVDVVERGKGFDDCEAGTIAYVTPEEIIAAVDAEELYLCFDVNEIYYSCGQFNLSEDYYFDPDAGLYPTLEDYAKHKAEEEGYTYTTLDDYYLHYGELHLRAEYEEESTYYPGYYSSFENYLEMEYGLKDIPTETGWQYGCNGGGVYCVGPYNIYQYETATFTANDISAQMRPGYKFPTTETVVTPNEVVVKISINGVKYSVDYFTIDPSNNTIGPNDNTITVQVGKVKKDVVVTPAEIEYKDVEKTPGYIKDITQDPSVAATNSNYSVKINNTTDELKQICGITDEEIAAGVNVWIELRENSAYIAPEDKALIENQLTDQKVGLYLDINLYKMSSYDTSPVRISETNGNLTFSIIVPENLRQISNRFEFYYVHEGVVKTIKPISYNSETGELVLNANEFSPYALVYKEGFAVQTGDASNLALFAGIGIISAAALALVVYKKKSNA